MEIFGRQEVNRYYYADPLAAAWMAKHFGMRFLNNLPMPPSYALWLRDYEFVCKPDNYTEAHSPIKFYIHPDSLRLLDPQEGDFYSYVENPGKPYSQTIFHKIYRTYILHIKLAIELGGMNDVRIIQRNGIAFMWPETETPPEK